MSKQHRRSTIDRISHRVDRATTEMERRATDAREAARQWRGFTYEPPAVNGYVATSPLAAALSHPRP